MTNNFFTNTLSQADKAIFASIKKETDRQKNQIELIASENIVSRAVLEAMGSVLTNKYAEGYPSKRYYGGCEFVDEVEALGISRLKELFGAEYVNIQPHSGATANQAAFYALLNPGDKILGMALSAGGHLTHGAAKTMSGTWFNSIQYGIREDNGLIDYDEVERLAIDHKPKLLIAGISSYPRILDWERFRAIADKAGCYLMVDMAHVAGLVAAGVYPSPVPFADVVTSTTHKTLRGPRGGIILSRDIELGKKLNSAVFPGLQGGPLMHVIAGKAVAFAEALTPEFKIYGKQVVDNAQALSNALIAAGLKITTGGTDCHLIVADLTPFKLTGKEAEKSLERAGLTCNKNAIPFDPMPPFTTSGIRLGTPAGTTRGFKEAEFTRVGELIAQVLAGLAQNKDNGEIEIATKQEVQAICTRFPIY